MRIGREMQTNSNPPQGTYFFVGVGVISWKCKKQPTIALFMMEAEYMATSHCIKETGWLNDRGEPVVSYKWTGGV